jgi:hypothetical protein
VALYVLRIRDITYLIQYVVSFFAYLTSVDNKYDLGTYTRVVILTFFCFTFRDIAKSALMEIEI